MAGLTSMLPPSVNLGAVRIDKSDVLPDVPLSHSTQLRQTRMKLTSFEMRFSSNPVESVPDETSFLMQFSFLE